jgi:hypothetical protein
MIWGTAISLQTYELEETVKNYVPESQELLVNGL